MCRCASIIYPGNKWNKWCTFITNFTGFENQKQSWEIRSTVCKNRFQKQDKAFQNFKLDGECQMRTISNSYMMRTCRDELLLGEWLELKEKNGNKKLPNWKGELDGSLLVAFMPIA